MRRAAVSLALSAAMLAGLPSWAMAQQVADQPASHVCVVKPFMIVDVGSAVQGVLERVPVLRGDRVKQGDVVGELESSVQAAEVQLAKVKAEFEDRRSVRMESLKNIISQQERDENETKRRIAHGELKRAEAELARRTIRSPISGVVVERNNDPGEFIRDNKFLKIVQIDPLTVEAMLPASMFAKVRKGSRVDVSFNAPGGGTRGGTLDVVDPVIDLASGTFGVQIMLPNLNFTIPAGITCDLKVLASPGN